jgi:hypothetical protein
MTPTPIGFRVIGDTSNRREIVAHERAMRAYCTVAPDVVNPMLPAFLSAFAFTRHLSDHFAATGSTAGYVGPVGVPYLNFDIDRTDLAVALADARRLAHFLAAHYACDPLIMFSGSKGFHVSIPTGGFIEPSPDAHRVAEALAVGLAAEIGVTIDEGVYDALRLWRAPNSLHPKTGLHKTRLDLNDLDYASVDWVRHRAAEPIPFDPPTVTTPRARLVADWHDTAKRVRTEALARREAHRDGAPRTGRINPTTRDFLADPTTVNVGDRHRVVFSAAADLAGFGTVDALIAAILTGPALDTGLPPKEVERQIQCGLQHGRQHAEGGAA